MVAAGETGVNAARVFLGATRIQMGIGASHSPLRVCARMFCCGAVIMAAYFGIYLALLESKVYWQIGIDPATGQNIFFAAPRYRVDGDSSDAFFFIAHRFDRWLRVDYWETIEHSSGRKWKNPPPTAPVIESGGNSGEPTE